MSNTFPLEELRSLLEKARTADAALKQFGAESHKYQWNPPASLKEIEEFEQETGVVLPDGYRNFLLQAGNGGAGSFYGIFPISASKGWPIEPDKLPWLTPDKSVEELEDVPDWKRGCIPIGSQGDTYITCLMVTGPDRDRVVYIEYERSWIFFPREPDFLSWYIRWLREAASGYDMGWFGIFLDGDEETLQKYYAQADTEEERLLAIDSMEKFPDLSGASQDFICSILDEWVMKEDVGSLPRLAYRVDPELYGQFLDKRWEVGLFDRVVYELYHTPADRKNLAKRDAQWEAERKYEFNIIQSIIKDVALYQEEIENWGYQVSAVMPDEEPEDEALQYYYRNYHQPVLVLTDADDGKYCFCYGFDGYTLVVSYTSIIERTSGEYEEVLKTVRLELAKRNRNQAPFEENLNEVGVSEYYDILVELNAKTFSIDEGKTIWNESGFWYTNYCSNNFVDCMRFGIGEVEREENSRSADCHIKQEYSAEQLLAFYRQGLGLQGRLIELYQSRISDK